MNRDNPLPYFVFRLSALGTFTNPREIPLFAFPAGKRGVLIVILGKILPVTEHSDQKEPEPRRPIFETRVIQLVLLCRL